jgi:hypothetical protein
VGLGSVRAVPSLSRLHDSVVELFRARPELVVGLLSDALGYAVPEHAQVRLASNDLNDYKPTEYTTDAVITLTGPNGDPVLAVIVEAQLRPDPNKRRAWPAYLGNLQGRLQCPVVLVVVSPTAGPVAGYAAPLDTGHPRYPLVRLGCDTSNVFEVVVVVQHDQFSPFGECGHDQVRELPPPQSGVRQRSLNTQRPPEVEVLDVQFRQYGHVGLDLIPLGSIACRCTKLQIIDRAPCDIPAGEQDPYPVSHGWFGQPGQNTGIAQVGQRHASARSRKDTCASRSNAASISRPSASWLAAKRSAAFTVSLIVLVPSCRLAASRAGSSTSMRCFTGGSIYTDHCVYAPM